jgi:glycine cleavage system H protein
MANIPKQLQYTKTHEWIKNDKGVLTIGITDHAQAMLGDLVFVELPETDSSFTYGQECAVLESVKAAADVYCPVSGEIIEINESVMSNPQLINRDPYGQGWLFRVRPSNTSRTQEGLLNAKAYQALVASETH